MAEDIDTELQAIKVLQETLEPLSSEVRTRVLEYVFRVLGIGAAPQNLLPLSSPHAPPVLSGSVQPSSPLHPVIDILSLKEEKDPKTATQMIAVVAYYLAHVAPENERQAFITTEEIQKYFVQAKYPMPGSLSQALINAKNAGYLDFFEKGKYRLNSVGYNLVAHKMPNDGGSTKKASNGGRRRPAKKVAKKVKR